MIRCHTFRIVILFCCVALPAFLSPAAEPEENDRPKLWFDVGERLTYQVYWGLIPIGESVVYSEWIEKEGQDLLSIKIKARTNKFMNKIYPVEDFMESVINPTNFLPVSYFRDVSEGNYRVKEITTFNHAEKKAHWKHLLKDKEHDFDIDADTRDLISFMFFMRSRKLEPKHDYDYRVMADEKVYDLTIKAGKYEKVRLPYLHTWVKSLKCEPEATFQGLFVRVGRIWVWVSDDHRRIATKVAARVPVASVKFLLKKVEGPGDDFYIEASDDSEESCEEESDEDKE